MATYVYYIEDVNDMVTSVGGSPVTPTAAKDYPGVDSNFFLAEEEPTEGQPDFTDLCITISGTAPAIIMERSDTSTYTPAVSIFSGPRPPHRPF